MNPSQLLLRAGFSLNSVALASISSSEGDTVPPPAAPVAAAASASSSGKSDASVGAIVGGVLGGLAALALIGQCFGRPCGQSFLDCFSQELYRYEAEMLVSSVMCHSANYIAVWRFTQPCRLRFHVTCSCLLCSVGAVGVAAAPTKQAGTIHHAAHCQTRQTGELTYMMSLSERGLVSGDEQRTNFMKHEKPASSLDLDLLPDDMCFSICSRASAARACHTARAPWRPCR